MSKTHVIPSGSSHRRHTTTVHLPDDEDGLEGEPAIIQDSKTGFNHHHRPPSSNKSLIGPNYEPFPEPREGAWTPSFHRT